MEIESDDFTIGCGVCLLAGGVCVRVFTNSCLFRCLRFTEGRVDQMLGIRCPQPRPVYICWALVCACQRFLVVWLYDEVVVKGQPVRDALWRDLRQRSWPTVRIVWCAVSEERRTPLSCFAPACLPCPLIRQRHGPSASRMHLVRPTARNFHATLLCRGLPRESLRCVQWTKSSRVSNDGLVSIVRFVAHVM